MGDVPLHRWLASNTTWILQEVERSDASTVRLAGECRYFSTRGTSLRVNLARKLVPPAATLPSYRGCVRRGNVGFYAIRQARQARPDLSRCLSHPRVCFRDSSAIWRRTGYQMQEQSMRRLTPRQVQCTSSKARSHSIVEPFRRKRMRRSRFLVPLWTLPWRNLGSAALIFSRSIRKDMKRAVLGGAKATLPQVARSVIELHGDMDDEKCLIDQMLPPAGLEPLVRRGCLVYYKRTGMAHPAVKS